MNILDEIVAQRKKDIAEKGYTLGFSVPDERKRKITPFLPQKGVILEVKRASPSKGDIAPGLDSAVTATEYARAGASAISVLTEEHWFKGSLNDLMNVCRAIDDYSNKTNKEPPAILRKDFLLSEEEIDVAYKAGADAVLLIARILDTQTMVTMAKKCQTLGLTALIELRIKEDLDKLKEVVKEVSSQSIVCGVNARDLRDFSIDLLTPVSILSEIKAIAGENVRVIFESGIRTEEAAVFSGSLGFQGLLLGEAAAKRPEEAGNLVSSFVNSSFNANSQAWTDFSNKLNKRQNANSKRPFVKICGITNAKDALTAARLGADFLGFIFYEPSPRHVEAEELPLIIEELKKAGLRDKVRTVGVIVSTDSKDSASAFKAYDKGLLDFIQLHGNECTNAFNAKDKAHYPVVNIESDEDLEKIEALRLKGFPRILIDAKIGSQLGGTGKRVSDDLLNKMNHKSKLWLAGGINPENVNEIIKRYEPELIDVSSGVEEKAGIKSISKLEALFNEINKIN